ncbi:MAG: hypothetical protein LBQ31_00375 [Bacteroidales bacterium]|jgi:hypothetical protein|nr:hypothetical protein [Bacteroidales bacterium]
MSKLNSLVSLVHSLSKSERKKISTLIEYKNKAPDYVCLFKLIEKDLFSDVAEIKRQFKKHNPNAALNVTVNYLLDVLLNILITLRKEQDSNFSLFNMLLQAKILYEKSIYKECFAFLNKVKAHATYFENYAILFIAQKMEMEYLLGLDFPKITENEFLKRYSKIRDTLGKIRKINEHTFLFELLRHRIINSGYHKQKQDFTDLTVSEISIVSNSEFNNFEIEKNHKLFQSNYLMNAGDYKSALNSLYELNDIFEKNMHLLSNPPIYYLSTIEGVLESLRTIRDYKTMDYFVEKLRAIKSSSNHFKLQVLCAVFLYKLFPLIDCKRFAEARQLLDEYRVPLIEKSNQLVLARHFKLMIYEAIVYFGNGEYEKAKKIFFRVFYSGKNSISLLHYRAARLLYLISLYELGKFEDIDVEINSIRKDFGKNIYQTERLLLKFVAKASVGRNYEIKMDSRHKSKNEMQLLQIFDFETWVGTKLLGSAGAARGRAE